VFVQHTTTSEDEVMETRLNLFENETAMKFAKRFANDDDQIAALVSLVALINAANRLAVIVHQKGGSYQPGMYAAFDLA